MTQHRNPSMHDVAARAGVSHQTVSRVLNNFPGVRADTRAKVLEAIEEMGYRRNLSARTLATGRSHSIGVLSPEVPNFGPQSSMHAVERAARKAGFHSLVTSTTSDPERVADAIDYLIGRSVDAIVVLAQQHSVLEVVRPLAAGVPSVYLLTGGVRDDDAISVDQVEGTRVALEHLTQLGHRHIQHVTGDLNFLEAQLRRDAFSAFLDEAGLDPLPHLEGSWSADSGYEAGKRIDPRATAVFCGNDQMALGLMHALSETGRRVPDDVSVIGFDDLPEAKHSCPPLTTVHQDFAGIGRLAVATLLAKLNNEPAPETAPLPPWLVVRDSTGPAPEA